MDFFKLIIENLQFYDTIKPKNPENSYTVLASLNDCTTGKLLALATGTQANLRTYPEGIEDCHAESLVKRAYKRYLIDTISSILTKSANIKDADKLIKELCNQNLILFVTQFPCGFIKRYEGEEPTDEHGKPIRRKPGRGTVKDGKTVYVDKDSCVIKLDKWLGTGLQGKRLNELFGIHSCIKTILIGDCEICDSFDYKSYIERLKRHFSEVNNIPQIELINQVRRDEFVFGSEKQPQPVASVWWSSSSSVLSEACSSSKRRKIDPMGTRELIVDGLKRGLTKKQLIRGTPSNKLLISNYTMRRDLDKIEQSFCQAKS